MEVTGSLGFCVPHATAPSPLVAATVPFSLAWEESPSPESQRSSSFRGAFPAIKGVWRRTRMAFSALKLPGPAWPFNYAGSSPVPRAFTPSGERKGPKQKSWLLLFSANMTSPMFFLL